MLAARCSMFRAKPLTPLVNRTVYGLSKRTRLDNQRPIPRYYQTVCQNLAVKTVTSELATELKLSEYASKHYPVLYTGEIGRISDYSSRLVTMHASQEDIIRNKPDLHVYKFGTTSNICRRITEHNRQFKYFDLKVLKGSLRHIETERMVSRELKENKLLYRLMTNGRLQREIVCFTEEWQKEWYLDLIDKMVREQLMDYKLFNEYRW